MKKNLYTDLWQKYVGVFTKAIKQESELGTQLDAKEFERRGNRKSYAFRIEMENGKVLNNLGSAVSRDLYKVLSKNNDFINASKGKHVVIRMGMNFDLHIEVSKR